MSQAELAAQLETKQPAIARIESGQVNITLKTLRALAEALNATARVEMAPIEQLERLRPQWWTHGPDITSGDVIHHVVETRIPGVGDINVLLANKDPHVRPAELSTNNVALIEPAAVAVSKGTARTAIPVLDIA